VYVSAWWRRVVAQLIDNVIMAIPIAIFAVIMGAVGVGRSVSCRTTAGMQIGSCTVTSGVSGLVVLDSLVVLIPPALYYGIMDGGRHGQTLGKMFAGITVRDVDTGGTVGFWRAALRPIIWNLFFYAFLIPGVPGALNFLFIPGALNFLWALWDPRHQCWHDKIARTTVARI
jgi:uncharacterized RDD family membrane protein YckC